MNKNDLDPRISRILKSAPPAKQDMSSFFEPGIASVIDYTLLRPDTTGDEISRLCDQARQYNFVSVCINPVHVPIAVKKLDGSNVRVGTVAGFPLGAGSTGTKVFEAEQAVGSGASEVDMVMQIGALKSGRYDLVARDISQVVDACRGQDAIVKVILETSLLTRYETVAGCLLAVDAGAAFVKTSTGFAKGGATLEDVTLMRGAVGPDLGVKAAGGIQSLSMAQAVLAAGANRIGSSSGVRIVEAFRAKGLAKNIK